MAAPWPRGRRPPLTEPAACPSPPANNTSFSSCASTPTTAARPRPWPNCASGSTCAPAARCVVTSGPWSKAGQIDPPPRGHREIHVRPEPPPADHLPLLGRIAAGRPIEAIDEAGFIQVPAGLRTAHPCYVLQVAGDSMREAAILDGDYVIVEQRPTARNGEIVVALIRGQEVTLKRIHQAPGRVVLRAENPAMPPLEYRPEEVEIQGVLVGQMRRYR